MSCSCQDQKDFQAANEGRRKIKFIKLDKILCFFCKEPIEKEGA